MIEAVKQMVGRISEPRSTSQETRNEESKVPATHKSGESKSSDVSNVEPRETNENSNEQAKKIRKKTISGGLAFSVTVCALGSGFQHGYNIGVINAPEELIGQWIKNVSGNDTKDLIWGEHHVTFIWSVIVSMFCTGGIFGACLTKLLADSLGRKLALWLNNILIVPGAVVEGFAKTSGSYKMLILGRFFIGINAGLNSGLAPMYVSEIAPDKFRGAIASVYQLCITTSIFLSAILGLESVFGTAELWPYLFGGVLIPALLQFMALAFCPESPRFLLVEKGKEELAERELKRLRCQREDVENEMAELRKEREEWSNRPRLQMRNMISNPDLRGPLIISVALHIGQQFSGIDSVIFFSTHIFHLPNLSHGNGHFYAQLGTLIMSFIVVIFSVVSLLLIDSVGRKPLLLIGFGGMTVVTIFLTIFLNYAEESMIASLVCFSLILLFVSFFAIGPGSVTWVLPPEYFDQSSRSLGVTISVVANWIANFLVGLAFLPLHEIMNAHVFIIFLVLLSFFFVYTWKKVPETKKKTIAQITAMFKQRSNS